MSLKEQHHRRHEGRDARQGQRAPGHHPPADWPPCKQREVDERIELDDVAVIAIVDKMLKQRKDSIEAFEKAARQDLADKEIAEVKVLQAYLPARLSADEVAAEVKAIVAELGAKGPGDMGKVMGAVKAKLAGKADMGQVSAAVKAALAG
jgi:uncharacterized protein YqeY